METWFTRWFASSKPVSDYARYQREALNELFRGDINRRLAGHFRLTPQRPRLPEAAASDPRITTLAALGFPSLYLITAYLDEPSARELGTLRHLQAPESCCVCGQPAEFSKPVDGEWIRANGRRDSFVVPIHRCPLHREASDIPLFAVIERFTGIHLAAAVGNGEAFLIAWAAANSSGDMTPPWRAFADELPEWGGWRQGNGEYWLHHVWLPFWDKLAQEERNRYLALWDAPPEWRENLLAY